MEWLLGFITVNISIHVNYPVNIRVSAPPFIVKKGHTVLSKRMPIVSSQVYLSQSLWNFHFVQRSFEPEDQDDPLEYTT